MKFLPFLSLLWSCGRPISANFRKQQPLYDRDICPLPQYYYPTSRISLLQEESMALKPFNLLIKQVLNQVDKHNRNGLNLRALISVAPRQQLLERAQFLDQERAAGKARSPLHGIPFIVKDAIATDPKLGMDTTAGSWALVGSAVGVSAGFGIVSLGVETDGSIVSPASRAALYALKPTIGTVSMDGVIPVSKSLDSVGAMARSPADLAMVIEMLQATGPNHDERLSQLMTQKWDGLRIGFRKEYHSVMKVLSDAGVYVEYPVQLPPGDKVWSGIGNIMSYEFQQVFNHYLETLDSSQVRNLQELVDWNRQHADRELPQEYPSQSSLESALQCNISATENAETLAFLRKLAGPDGIDRILNLFNLDAIASLADSPLSSVASAAGYPIATMPLGILDMNGRPFGISMTASKHQEKKLFQIMSAWETLGARQPPPALMEEIHQAQPS
ncbi:amidase signature domain-containing protein [Trichoderma pleuroticola]